MVSAARGGVRDLAISVELAVGDHVHHAVRLLHRLAAVVQADDRESRCAPVSTDRRATSMCPCRPGPAMFETLQAAS